MDTSVTQVTVWHHSAEPRDAKTMTHWTDLSIRTSHSCQILIFWFKAQFGCNVLLIFDWKYFLSHPHPATVSRSVFVS